MIDASSTGMSPARIALGEGARGREEEEVRSASMRGDVAWRFLDLVEEDEDEALRLGE
jgi:hypothetical protein